MYRGKSSSSEDDFYAAMNPLVRTAGYYRAESGYTYRTTRPVNPDFDLWYGEAGTGEVYLNGRWHECAPGDVLVITPGTRYEKERSTGNEPWLTYFVHLWPFGSAESPYNALLMRRLPSRTHLGHRPGVRDRFASLFEAWTLRRERALEVKAHALRLLDVLLDSVGNASLPASPAFDKLLRAREYLTVNYTQDATLDEAAEYADMSPSYLMALFKQYYGCSPIHYRIDLQLREAKLLLARGESVKATATRAGFHSQHYFSRLFRKRFSLSPSEFAGQCVRARMNL